MRRNTIERTLDLPVEPCTDEPGLFKKIYRKFNCFGKDSRGNAAIIFGISLVPLLVAVGSVVDYSRAFIVQQRLSQAIDATALAVGASVGKSDSELQQIAKNYFNANYPERKLGIRANVNLTIADEKITVIAAANVPTVLMGIVGINSLDVTTDTEVVKSIRNMELVMVLDNTGSMRRNSKIDALKTAAKDLVNILYGEQSGSELLKIGLVPFSASVNIGADKLTSGWVDVNAESSLHGVAFSPASNIFDLYNNKLKNTNWNGCIEARPYPLDVSDTPPASGDTLWVPYFAPDEPSDTSYRYPNSYLPDDISDPDPAVVQQFVPKYDDETPSRGGPGFNCNLAEITPLIDDKAAVLSSIDAMNASGNTVIPIGLGWGWRVLSPTEPYSEGVDYSDKLTDKILVLLTDGKNDIGRGVSSRNHNKSYYNGYGFVAQNRLGTTNSSAAHSELDNRTAALCSNIKNAGVIVYSVTFQVTDPGIKNLMRNCATDGGKYFDAVSNAQLSKNFKEIAIELSKLRISK